MLFKNKFTNNDMADGSVKVFRSKTANLEKEQKDNGWTGRIYLSEDGALSFNGEVLEQDDELFVLVFDFGRQQPVWIQTGFEYISIENDARKVKNLVQLFSGIEEGWIMKQFPGSPVGLYARRSMKPYFR